MAAVEDYDDARVRSDDEAGDDMPAPGHDAADTNGAEASEAAAAEEEDPYYTEEMRQRNEELDAVAAEIEAAYAAALNGGDAASPHPLSEKVVSASLSNLGHNADGRVVYTTATLSSLSLSSVDVLARFKHLQKILLDQNHLESVAPLSACDSLVHVSLCGNQLTESVFQELAGAADTLQFVDVSHNRLTTLHGVHQFRFLNTLLAENNQIAEIKATGQLAELSSLWKLSLASNAISHVESGSFRECPLRLLDLSKNELHDLHNLLDLTRTLTVLGVEDNALMHISDVLRFTELSTVSLAGNNLYDMAEVHELASLRLLRTLTLIGNPLCSFGAMPDAPVDDDAASDIVCRDDDDDEDIVASDTAPHRPVAANIAAATAARAKQVTAEPSRTVPSAVHAAALCKPQNAPFQPQPPQEADEAQLSALSEEQRYRLHVIWRVPKMAVLDGVEVTAEESANASYLVGGVDRDQRQNAERLLSSTKGGGAAAGSAMAAARSRNTA